MDASGDEGILRVSAAVRAVSDLVHKPVIIGLDFADVRAVLHEGGLAFCGHGTASGPGRATRATEAALADLREQIRRCASGKP